MNTEFGYQDCLLKSVINYRKEWLRKGGNRIPDPAKVTGAVKITYPIFRNGKPYELNIIYEESTQTILHFHYQ